MSKERDNLTTSAQHPKRMKRYADLFRNKKKPRIINRGGNKMISSSMTSYLDAPNATVKAFEGVRADLVNPLDSFDQDTKVSLRAFDTSSKEFGILILS